MQEFTVCFHSFRDIQEFSKLCSAQGFRILIGNDRYQVNATSLLGMLSLNCRKPQRVSMECSEEQYDRFRQQALSFLAET